MALSTRTRTTDAMMKCSLFSRGLAAFALSIMLATAPVAARAVDRAASTPVPYPPNWWVGMRNTRLQLMVQGVGIATAEPTLDRNPRARIAGIIRGDSPNYLFIDLVIAADATPGELVFRFARSGGDVSLRYPLWARAPGSAQRRGFGTRDVILNLMPDRFANGDSRNDRVKGYAQGADRNDLNARHGGDLRGMRNHLDHIAGMGYTMIWPTPLIENAQTEYSYHGYAATDLYRIDPRYGSNAEYRDFVAEARSKGLGVIQDVVPNHIGDGHPWLKDPPTADWITLGGRFEPTHHGRTAVADPYAAQVDRDNFTQGWFVATMPDLNQQQPLLATYLTQNTIWWIEYADLSGLRVDTFGYSDMLFSPNGSAASAPSIRISRWSARSGVRTHRSSPVGRTVGSTAVRACPT
jgi:neopullulanase